MTLRNRATLCKDLSFVKQTLTISIKKTYWFLRTIQAQVKFF